MLSGKPALDVDCFLARIAPRGDLLLEAELLEGERTLAKASRSFRVSSASDPDAADDPVTSAPVYLSTETVNDPAKQTIWFTEIDGIKLWDLASPNLYTVRVRLLRAGSVIDEDTRRIGFRETMFTDHGFSLNGKIVKLRGLNRHQTFPFAGQAMPARVQRQDAKILRHSLHCNIVRISHYPQSRIF